MQGIRAGLPFNLANHVYGCVVQLENGKASGPYELVAENLKDAHPIY